MNMHCYIVAFKKKNKKTNGMSFNIKLNFNVKLDWISSIHPSEMAESMLSVSVFRFCGRLINVPKYMY